MGKYTKTEEQGIYGQKEKGPEIDSSAGLVDDKEEGIFHLSVHVPGFETGFGFTKRNGYRKFR